MKTKQHYVFRQYLRAWAKNDKIKATRLGKIFTTELMNIAQQRYFYKISELTEADINFIKESVIGPSSGFLQDINTKWIDMFMAPQRIKQNLIDKGVSTLRIDEVMKPIFIEFDEDFHASIESQSIKYINNLLSLDLTIFNERNNFHTFTHYLSVQYFRTKKIKENCINCATETYRPILERTWNVLAHIFSTNLSYELSTGGYRLVILTNKSELKFITSDQPVINTLAYDRKVVNDMEVEIYYPLSPTVAVLLTKKLTENEILEIKGVEVERYNKMINYFHHEIIFDAD
ncbi:DUF4238 domain-containing protein [Yersinia enterocolitica]